MFGVSRGAEHALLLTQLLAEDGSAALPDAVAVHSPPMRLGLPSSLPIFRQVSLGRVIGSVPHGPGVENMNGPALERCYVRRHSPAQCS